MTKRHLKLFNTEDEFNNNKNLLKKPYAVAIKKTQSGIYEPEVDYSLEYFTIEALEEGTVGIGMPNECDVMAYSLNDNTWQFMNEAVQIPVQANDTVKIKCETNRFLKICTSLLSVSCTFNVYGNVMSLLYGDEFKDKTSLGGYDSCFMSLFSECTPLVSAENLILPATTLTDSCYSFMFNGCSNLTTAPSLPATTLADYCYSNMFDGCRSLTTAPALPATTLADRCYSLMFYGCSQLTKITMLATDISASSCLNAWVYGVASSGTFIKHPVMKSLPSGTSGIPSGWNVEDYQG